MVGIWTVGFMPPIPYPPTGPGSLSWPLPPGPIPSGYSMGYEFLFPLPGGVGLGSGGIRGGGVSMDPKAITPLYPPLPPPPGGARDTPVIILGGPLRGYCIGYRGVACGPRGEPDCGPQGIGNQYFYIPYTAPARPQAAPRIRFPMNMN